MPTCIRHITEHRRISNNRLSIIAKSDVKSNHMSLDSLNHLRSRKLNQLNCPQFLIQSPRTRGCSGKAESKNLILTRTGVVLSSHLARGRRKLWMIYHQ